MQTQQQIFDNLSAAHPIITRQVDDTIIVLSDDERAAKLSEWAAQKYLDQTKSWINAEHFMSEFSMAEKAAIALSTDTTIAALRMELSTWLSPVRADDARVQQGMGQLVTLGIITSSRKAAILGE